MNEVIKNEQKSIFKVLISVSGVAIIAKVLSYIKQVIVAAQFGATIETDILNLSNGIISSADYLFVTVISTATIPIYIRLKDNEMQAKEFVHDVLKALCGIALVLSFAFLLFSGVFAKILAPSYSKELLSVLSRYIRIYALTPIFIILSAFFTALLNANKRFYPAQTTSIVQTMLTIVLVLLFAQEVGINILVIAFFITSIINVIVLGICSKEYCLFSKSKPVNQKYIKEVAHLMLPLLLGQSVLFINRQVDRMIMSGFEEGSITALGYSSMLIDLVISLIVLVCTTLYTYITQYIVAKRENEMVLMVEKASIIMVTIVLFVVISAVFNADDIMALLFGYGRVNDKAISIAATALRGYSLAMLMSVIKEVFARVAYGYGDTKRPMISATIGIGINIVLSILLSRWYGVMGITLATSFSVTVTAVLNYLVVRRINRCFRVKIWIERIPQWILGSGTCFAISVYGQLILANAGVLIRVAAIILASAVVFFGINIFVIKEFYNKKTKKV